MRVQFDRRDVQHLTYDSLGRLSAAGEYRGDGGGRSYLLNYDYDTYGNRYQQQSRNQHNPVAQSWVEEHAYHLTTNRFTSGVTYDEAGNILTDARFRRRQFGHDANSRQQQSAHLDGTSPVVSVYDGAGQRVATTADGQLTDVMVYDAFGELVAEYGQSVSQGGTQYVMGDHQGSTRVVMSGSTVVSRRDYLPFGEEIPGGVGLRAGTPGYGQSDGVRQRYAGMEGDDSTGMSHTLWRKFDALSARWTSPDPYGGSMELASPQTLNRYTYVNNDPVNKVDPSGLMLSDIGVVQTTNRGAALRLERAGVTVLRRYVEGQAGRAQRRQRATQRANAAFTAGMGASASGRYGGFFDLPAAPQNPVQPFDVPGVRSELERMLSNADCADFVKDILGRVSARFPDNPLVEGGDVLKIFDRISQGGGLIRSGGPGSIPGSSFALGSFATDDARIQIGSYLPGGTVKDRCTDTG